VDMSTPDRSKQPRDDMEIFLESQLQKYEFKDLSSDTKMLIKSTLISKADGMYDPATSSYPSCPSAAHECRARCY
jgi:hypothetical protein